MSKRQFKSQASSGRAAAGAFAGSAFGGAAVASNSPFGAVSTLSYISEPPDLSSISQPHVVVAFKNLSKKDATTKAKALEELQSYINSHEVGQNIIEDTILEAWIKLYPRTAIDSSRRVRQLAHTLQGSIAALSGKRFAKHMPKVVGAWLAGLYDNDRPVARAASESFSHVFPTDEKIRGVWKAYEHPILEYAGDALIKETPQTLSDERIMSPDDVEANSLNVDQTGSAWDFSEAIIAITSGFPNIWTDAYAGKKPVALRLRQYLRRGSQGGPAEVWQNFRVVLKQVPPVVLPSDLGEAVPFLEDMHHGLAGRDEPKINQHSAWISYVETVVQMCAPLTVSQQIELLRQRLLPIFEQYVRPTLQSAEWSAGSRSLDICTFAATSLISLSDGEVSKVFEEDWRRIGTMLVEDIETSLPEQSKDYEKSQAAIAEEGERFAALSELLLADSNGTYAETLAAVFHSTVDVLRSRRGKPYGAAAIIRSFLQRPQLLRLLEAEKQRFLSFFTDDAPHLWQSPSFPILVSILAALSEAPGQASSVVQPYDALLQSILAQTDSPEKMEAIRVLLSSLTADLQTMVTPNPELDLFIVKMFEQSMQRTASAWGLVVEAIGHGDKVVSDSTVQRVLSKITTGLTISEQAAGALDGVDSILATHGALIRERVSSKSDLLVNLLSLTESANEDLAVHAERTNALVEATLSKGKDGLLHQSLLEVIVAELITVSANSLSVPSLVERAQKLLDDPEHDPASVAATLLPSEEQWAAALKPFVEVTPNPSTAITDILSSSVYLVSKARDRPSPRLPRDSQGHSTALRIAMFVTQLIKTAAIFELLGHDTRLYLLRMLLLSVQSTNDDLSVSRPDGMWISRFSSSDVEEEIVDFVSDAQHLIQEWVKAPLESKERTEEGAGESPVMTLQRQLRDRSGGRSATSFCHARAAARIGEELIEAQGWQKGEIDVWSNSLKVLKISDDPFALTSLVIGCKVPIANQRIAVRLCNEIASELTSHEYSHGPEDSLRSLVMFNAIIQYQDVDIPPQRLVPLVKNLLSWRSQGLIAAPQASAEVARVLTVLLPLIQEVYGEHWSVTLHFIELVWSDVAKGRPRDAELPPLHATLRLYGTLKKIRHTNDDADDAWNTSAATLSKMLLAVLKAFPGQPESPVLKRTHADCLSGDASGTAHQPLEIVQGLLARQIADIPPHFIDDVKDLFPLLYSESPSIQQAAFGLLHRHIPETQEEISLEIALAKKAASLPEELLSLVLEAPTLESLAYTSWDRSMPVLLRGYLLSWMLIFDHFTRSSFKVRSDYVENIKDGGYLKGLLDFTFDFLGHDRGKPVDATRFTVTSYDLDVEDLPERDAQWLLCHLYYLCLKHLPSLTKAWWVDCPRRQKVLSIESWTEKYLSPLIIADELATVSEWVASPAFSEGEGEMSVKVSKNAKEVTASYEVDEQTMQIVIKLPGTFPLRQAVVEGVNRVGVDEKKWRSWLINTQGVITFSNGSIVDGLTAWRKNVTGAMKGQTECAICYSIISADKQLPSKRCGTCKNLFHSSCLFRWFKSSNSSSCPLCRNAFNYG
ncbi:MAG: hypothetical protein M1817_002001 [Caeruleum heppii]|nr:MAG: hypothetical protein M1817_002001 [Caeruleum heppii]